MLEEAAQSPVCRRSWREEQTGCGDDCFLPAPEAPRFRSACCGGRGSISGSRFRSASSRTSTSPSQAKNPEQNPTGGSRTPVSERRFSDLVHP